MILTVLSAVVLPLLASYTAHSSPERWSKNRHYYEFVEGNFTWQEAKAAGEASCYKGVVGHLVTITSPDENAFVLSAFGSKRKNRFAWIAAVEPNDDGKWQWDAGPENGVQFSAFGNAVPPFNFAKWGGIEPNDDKPNEDFAMINIGLRFAGIRPGEWADAIPTPNESDPVVGYIVEYEMSEE